MGNDIWMDRMDILGGAQERLSSSLSNQLGFVLTCSWVIIKSLSLMLWTPWTQLNLLSVKCSLSTTTRCPYSLKLVGHPCWRAAWTPSNPLGRARQYPARTPWTPVCSLRRPTATPWVGLLRRPTVRPWVSLLRRHSQTMSLSISWAIPPSCLQALSPASGAVQPMSTPKTNYY